MDYPDFVRLQQETLIRQFLEDPGNAWIGVPSIEAFGSRNYGRGGWRALPGASVSEAVIYSDGGPQGELWVKPYEKTVGTGAYRRYWSRFLSAYQVTGASSTVNGRAMTIDHLLAETPAARRGFAFVRMIAVEARANATVGSTIEKALASSSSPNKSYLADWFTIAKASGFRGSFGLAATPQAVMEALRRHLESSGYRLPSGAKGSAALAEQEATCMEAILKWSRGAPTS